jgi:hypothetical protein
MTRGLENSSVEPDGRLVPHSGKRHIGVSEMRLCPWYYGWPWSLANETYQRSCKDILPPCVDPQPARSGQKVWPGCMHTPLRLWMPRGPYLLSFGGCG